MFTHSFMTKQTLQVAIVNIYSTPREIENGVVKGAVLSVTIFLVAMAEICRGIEGPTRMLGKQQATKHQKKRRHDYRRRKTSCGVGQTKKESPSPLKKQKPC
jgi:hypothetical protein